MTEWREIEGFPGYDVSDDGLVRSWHRRGLGSALARVPRTLALCANAGGYFQVNLRSDDGLRSMLIHRLVLSAFVGPCPDGMEGCHNDGSKTNNAAPNLRWGTHAANMLDKVSDGTVANGERNGRAKLTWAAVRDIRGSMQGQASLARTHGVSQSCISRVLVRQSWKHDPQHATGGAECS